MLARRIKSPFEHVPRDHERARDDAIPGDLRVRADIDECSAGTQCAQGLSRIEPMQSASCVSEQLMDRCSRHAANPIAYGQIWARY